MQPLCFKNYIRLNYVLSRYWRDFTLLESPIPFPFHSQLWWMWGRHPFNKLTRRQVCTASVRHFTYTHVSPRLIIQYNTESLFYLSSWCSVGMHLIEGPIHGGLRPDAWRGDSRAYATSWRLANRIHTGIVCNLIWSSKIDSRQSWDIYSYCHTVALCELNKSS